MNTLFDGHYEIIKVLGEGGMGRVYLARNIKLDTLWAIKQVSKKTDSKFDLLAEPNILKKLKHPALPRIFDILEDEQNIYIIEDYIEGVSLDQALKTNGKYPEAVVVDWAKQICDVYQYLHAQKPNPVIYRDMKPGNLIVDSEEKVKLIDFGIAREYKEESEGDTQYIGTRGYAAPEQYGKSQSDARTDIYSLGITLYHLVTGKSPNEPPYEIKPVRQFNKKLSRGIEHIIKKCTQQDPANRYQSTNKLLSDLNNIQKFDKEHKRQILVRDIKTALFILMFFASGLSIYMGFEQMEVEKSDKYENLVQMAQLETGNGNFENAISVFSEARLLYPEKIESYRGQALVYIQKAEYDECIAYISDIASAAVEGVGIDPEFNYMMGTAYYEKEDYQKALFYFERTLMYDRTKENYLRDYGVSLARNGNLDLAEQVLKEIKDKHLAEEVSFYVSGEIQYAKKNFNDAIRDFEQCIQNTTDEIIKRKSFVTSGEIFRDYGDKVSGGYSKGIDLMTQALNTLKNHDDLYIIEMLAELNFKISSDIQDQTQSIQYMNESVKYFEKLLSLGYKRNYIYKNISIIHMETGDNEKAQEVLFRMKEQYPEDYRPYIQLAFLYAEMESKKPNETRNYTKVYDSYKLAVEYSPDKEKNPELQQLNSMIQELKDKKWIQ